MAIFFFLQLVAVSTFTATAAAAANGSPSSTSAATSFLRARCNVTKYPDTCYELLLAYAESFHGSRAKVAHTAATIAVAKQHHLTEDLARLKLQATGAGRAADMTVVDCYNDVSVQDYYAYEMMGHLDKLASGVKSRADFSSEKHEAMISLGSAMSAMEDCQDWLNDAGKEALSTQTVKEVLAGCQNVTIYMSIALYLTDTIRWF